MLAIVSFLDETVGLRARSISSLRDPAFDVHLELSQPAAVEDVDERDVVHALRGLQVQHSQRRGRPRHSLPVGRRVGVVHAEQLAGRQVEKEGRAGQQ